MGKKRFAISVECYGEFVLELDDAAIDAVDVGWRDEFYDLFTPADIAEHIAYNMIVNEDRLSQLDGWADQPDSNAKLQDYYGLRDLDWEFSVKEMKDGD